MRRKNKEQRRVKEIASVFLKYGISNPAGVRSALEELGPTFVKMGQILSTRPDILPEAYIWELQKLQDDVKPESYDTIKEVIEKDLKRPIEELFVQIDEIPIASASLAQVHYAILPTGEEVIVKVQRPGVRESMMRDLALLKRVTRLAKFAPKASVVDMQGLVDELTYASQQELNFLKEANNIKTFHKYNKDVKFITCPKVYDDYTTSNIIVMDYIDGIKIGLVDRLIEEEYDLEDMAIKLTNNYLKQVFQDGFFHGDPHPGNILISGTKIAYIDFGIMGTLNKSLKEKLNNLLYGVATKNVDLMTTAVLNIGLEKGPVDRKKLYSDIEEIYNRYIEISLYDINIPQFMDEMIKACRKNNLIIPRDLTMLAKGIMTIEGVIEKLAPHINIMDIIIPYIKTHMISERDIKKEAKEQLENIYNLIKCGLKIPVKFLELINSALAGKLKIRLEHEGLDEAFNIINQMVNRLVFGIIVGSLVIGSSIVLSADVGPKIGDIPIIGFIGYAGAGIMGLWLLISMLRSGKM
ncbi:MAG TPA: AarF/ABC1/UbiB kinase family protein [Clostridiales bacterium]|nr:AarF/ABC1/UbiB kinase family protein [Clostridiales bacterium]